MHTKLQHTTTVKDIMNYLRSMIESGSISDEKLLLLTYILSLAKNKKEAEIYWSLFSGLIITESLQQNNDEESEEFKTLVAKLYDMVEAGDTNANEILNEISQKKPIQEIMKNHPELNTISHT